MWGDSAHWITHVRSSIFLAVLLAIKRRQVEQIKVAIPVILRALKQASLGLDDENEILQDLFSGAIGIADSICSIHQKLVCMLLIGWLFVILQITQHAIMLIDTNVYFLAGRHIKWRAADSAFPLHLASCGSLKIQLLSQIFWGPAQWWKGICPLY